MKSRKWIYALLAAAAAPASAAQPMGCLIEPDRVAEVGSPVVGVVENVLVERGDRVAKGQVLAVLRSDVERANVTVARSRADSDADVHAAAANAEFTRQRLVRAEDLVNRKFISQQALDQARTEAEVAQQKLAQARDQRRLWNHELGVASAQLSQRVIRSPIDGVIAERYVWPGERVEERPLFRVAKVDPLRVQVIVPSVLYGRIEAGGEATVSPELPGAVPAKAHVRLIDKVIDAASNTFRVTLELPNGDFALPAGLRCKADFGPDVVPPGRGESQATPGKARPAGLKLDSGLSTVKPTAPAQPAATAPTTRTF